ncbi:hypothetical protein [Mycolicibacter minnesotensis]
MEFSDGPQVVTRLVLLGENETVDRRAELAEHAATRRCAVIDAFGFFKGQASSTGDLTEVDAVVKALGRAIAGRLDIWVPFPGSDLVREQHVRRMSLVLQRHGLNLRVGPRLVLLPVGGGVNEIDMALRREVRAVDELDQAALASEGAENLSREIAVALSAANGAHAVRDMACEEAKEGWHRRLPVLPSPTVPWPERNGQLERYVSWLVDDCGVAQAAAARVLNSAGQCTPTGRQWQSGTVANLLKGKYGDRRRPDGFTPDAEPEGPAPSGSR